MVVVHLGVSGGATYSLDVATRGEDAGQGTGVTSSTWKGLNAGLGTDADAWYACISVSRNC
jgi:hypothetical protein